MKSNEQFTIHKRIQRWCQRDSYSLCFRNGSWKENRVAGLWHHLLIYYSIWYLYTYCATLHYISVLEFRCGAFFTKQSVRFFFFVNQMVHVIARFVCRENVRTEKYTKMRSVAKNMTKKGKTRELLFKKTTSKSNSSSKGRKKKQSETLIIFS